MHRNALFLLLTAVQLLGFQASARAASLTPFVGRLEEHLAANERLDILTAHQAIVAWVCAEETGTDDGVRFEGCCKSVADFVFTKEAKSDFLGAGRGLQRQAEQCFAEQSIAAEPFWANFGVAPATAAACADAMLHFKQNKGFWDASFASRRLDICLTKNLAPDMMSKLQPVCNFD